MNAQTPPAKKITLEEITERKRMLLDEIRAQKTVMAHTAREIFAPLTPAANKTNALMRSFDTGMAIFDGVMLGVKFMRKVRSYFRRMK